MTSEERELLKRMDAGDLDGIVGNSIGFRT